MISKNKRIQGNEGGKANIVNLENTGKRGRESMIVKTREYKETRVGKHDCRNWTIQETREGKNNCKNKRIQGNEGGKE